uniref:Uncharacterized protein n=1 Tax=Opuntia streptacantha TaxID=393608 RepID=A0A7C8ZUX4_OPUST
MGNSCKPTSTKISTINHNQHQPTKKPNITHNRQPKTEKKNCEIYLFGSAYRHWGRGFGSGAGVEGGCPIGELFWVSAWVWEEIGKGFGFGPKKLQFFSPTDLLGSVFSLYGG